MPPKYVSITEPPDFDALPQELVDGDRSLTRRCPYATVVVGITPEER